MFDTIIKASLVSNFVGFIKKLTVLDHVGEVAQVYALARNVVAVGMEDPMDVANVDVVVDNASVVLREHDDVSLLEVAVEQQAPQQLELALE